LHGWVSAGSSQNLKSKNITLMGLNRTKRGFDELPDPDVSNTLGKTAIGLDDNEAYPDAPTKSPALVLIKKDFDDSIVRAMKGGTLATATKDTLRNGAVVTLTKNANYVDIQCGDSLEVLLSSGYEAVSTNRAQSILNPPQILSVNNLQKGQLKASINADSNSRSFIGRIKTANGGEFGPNLSFANSRSIIFKGLIAGVQYAFELCAVGGSTGQSDWSPPGSGMAQ
jgi:hypothetical protein